MTPMQERIAAHWRELLDVSEVKPADGFLDLGGNSLLATMLANRLEEELGVRPSMTDVFAWTLGELAAWCEQEPGPAA